MPASARPVAEQSPCLTAFARRARVLYDFSPYVGRGAPCPPLGAGKLVRYLENFYFLDFPLFPLTVVRFFWVFLTAKFLSEKLRCFPSLYLGSSGHFARRSFFRFFRPWRRVMVELAIVCIRFRHFYCSFLVLFLFDFFVSFLLCQFYCSFLFYFYFYFLFLFAPTARAKFFDLFFYFFFCFLFLLGVPRASRETVNRYRRVAGVGILYTN